jgi:hypothetical protein
MTLYHAPNTTYAHSTGKSKSMQNNMDFNESDSSLGGEIGGSFWLLVSAISDQGKGIKRLRQILTVKS